MTKDLDPTLHALLTSLPVDVPTSSLARVTTRARQRVRRRRAVGVVCASMAMIGGGLFIATRPGDQPSRVITATPAPTTATSSTVTTSSLTTVDTTITTTLPAGSFSASKLTWKEVPATGPTYSPQNGGRSRRAGDTLVGISQIGAFGPAGIFTSNDGVTWQNRLLPKDFLVHDATIANGAFYASGTVAGAAAVASSTDGSTWNTNTMPIVVGSFNDGRTSISADQSSVEHFGNVTAVVVNVSAGFDDRLLLPPGVDRQDGFAVLQGDSVELRIPTEAQRIKNAACAEAHSENTESTCEFEEPSVAATYKLSDSSLDPKVINALQHPIRIFVSTSGGPFEEVSLPTHPDSVIPMFTDSHGFVIIAASLKGTTSDVLRSADGRNWRKIGEMNGFGCRVRSNNGITIISSVQDNGDVAFSQLTTDGMAVMPTTTRFASTPTIDTSSFIADSMDGNSVSRVGSQGLSQDALGPVHLNGLTFSRAAVRYTQQPGQLIDIVDDATNNRFSYDPAASTQAARLRIDGGNLIVLDAAGGVQLTIDQADLDQKLANAEREAQLRGTSIFDSADRGTSWSATKLTDIVDISKVAEINNLIVVKDRYILTVRLVNPDGSLAYQTFIGQRL